MTRLTFPRFVFRVLLALVVTAGLSTRADASVISLGSPLTGVGVVGEIFELTVNFDLNGAAPNLVGQELYVDFSGLGAVAGSYQIGSVFTPDLSNVIGFDGDCATTGCNDPGGVAATAGRYLSFASAFVPFTPTGTGSLFTLQFMSTGLPWSLNLLGDDTFSMLTDQTGSGGSPVDLMPFAIVPSGATVPLGTAKISVDFKSLSTPPPPPPVVPEPASLVLTGTGLAALARVVRRRRTAAPAGGAE